VTSARLRCRARRGGPWLIRLLAPPVSRMTPSDRSLSDLRVRARFASIRSASPVRSQLVISARSVVRASWRAQDISELILDPGYFSIPRGRSQSGDGRVPRPSPDLPMSRRRAICSAALRVRAGEVSSDRAVGVPELSCNARRYGKPRCGAFSVTRRHSRLRHFGSSASAHLEDVSTSFGQHAGTGIGSRQSSDGFPSAFWAQNANQLIEFLRCIGPRLQF